MGCPDKRDLRGMILSLLLLAVTSFSGSEALPTEHHIARTPLEKDLTISINSESHDGASSVLSNGVLWELPPEEIAPGTSSSVMHKLPDVVCTEEGFQSVPGSCEEFIYCKDLSSEGLEDWYIFWFTCEEGKFFDRELKKCQPQALDSRYQECQSETAALHEQRNLHINLQYEELEGKSGIDTTVDRSASASDTTAKLTKEVELLIPHTNSENMVSHGSPDIYSNDNFDFATTDFQTKHTSSNRVKRSGSPMQTKSDIVALTANQTCGDVKNIDSYVSHIRSKNSVTFSSHSEEIFTNIIKEYNGNLKKAQENSKAWDNSNGVLAVVKMTFQLTRDFEPKFTERFKTMKKRVTAILEKDKIDIKSIEEEMKKVRKEIQELEELLDMSINIKVNKFILENMQDDLKMKKKKHSTLTMEYRKAEKETEFQELTEILAFVRDNAIEIQSKTQTARTKMEEFRAVIMEDSSRFKKAYERAGQGLQTLTTRETNNKNELKRLENRKRSLESQISENRNHIARVQQQRQHDEETLRREMDWLRRKKEAAQEKKKIGGLLMIIPVAGWIAGGIMLGQGISEKKDAVRRLEATIQDYVYKENNYNAQLRSLNSMVTASNNNIGEVRRKTQQLQKELPNLRNVRNKLGELQGEVNTIVPFISKAISSLEKLKEIFHDTEQDLNLVITQAGDAHSSSQKRLVSYFMYNEVEEKIKKHWENAKEKIIDVGNCVM